MRPNQVGVSFVRQCDVANRHYHASSFLAIFLLLSSALRAQSAADNALNRCQMCISCQKQSFSVHAKNGTRFKLVFQFSDYRWGVTGTHWYQGSPVILAYNTSCLRASHITYHKWQKTIEAWIDVRLEDGSGKQERFDAVLFKIDNGTLTPIKLLHGKEPTAF